MRLFVALNLPDDVRGLLTDAVRPLRDARYPVTWVRPENVHLSLKFLGEVAETREAEIVTALHQAVRGKGARGIPLHIEGFGVFPDFRRPGVIWAGVDPEPALELLQDAVERAFAPLGFPAEGRPFRPHLTLGRASRHATPRDFRGLDAALGGIAFDATAVVGEVDVMESTLQAGGPVYRVRQRGRLS